MRFLFGGSCFSVLYYNTDRVKKQTGDALKAMAGEAMPLPSWLSAATPHAEKAPLMTPITSFETPGRFPSHDACQDHAKNPLSQTE